MSVLVRTPPKADSAFSEYVARLVELHELMSTGQEESEAAEAVRDRMDAPWQRLSAEQVALVNGLSADLYSLEEQRHIVADLSGDAAEFAAFERAVHEGDWPAALDIVRRNENRLEPYLVSYLRGTCWAHLGEPEAALLFLRDAARLHPLGPEEEIWLLTCLIQAGQLAEALPRAREIARTSMNPMLMLGAAEVLFVSAFEQPDALANSMRREAVELAERGLAAAEEQPRNELLDSLRVGALMYIALTYDLNGNRTSAIDACRRALQIDPERKTALELLGFLSFENFPSTRREPFRHRFAQQLRAESKSNGGLALVETS